MRNRMEDFYEALDCRYTQGDRDEVERLLLEYRKEAEGDRADTEMLIAVCNELGGFYRGEGRYAQSLAAFAQARAAAAETLGKDCVQYATILNNMAGTQRLMSRYEEAIDLFRQALAIYEQQGETESCAYASLLNNLSLAYRETRQLAPAIDCLERACALIERYPRCTQELAVTYNNLTALYEAAGDKNRAMQSLNCALQQFEKCADEENVHYAAGLNSLAGFLYTEGEYERAIQLYRRSGQYTKRFFGENIEYAITCRNMCWAYQQLGRQKDADAALQKAYEVFERLLGAEHERTRAAADDLRRLRANFS